MGPDPRPKFAVVREDPNVEHALCRQRGAGSVLVVASGGCTALTLAASAVDAPIDLIQPDRGPK